VIPPPALTVNPPDFPVVGNNVPIALFFMLHIAIAEYSLGAIAIAPVMEWHAVRSGDARAMRYARALVNSYYLVFSLGATLAVFAVVLLTGLWGRAWAGLLNVFLPLVGVLFGLFLILVPLLVVYRNTFGRMRPGRHVALGFAVLVLQALFVVGITALDSYLITPRHAGLLGGAGNPPYLPLLIHRLAGSVSWTALFLAGFAAVMLARASAEDERVFQAWAARVNVRIGLFFAVVMPVDGFVLVEVLKHSQPGFFDNLVNGQAAWLFIVQEALFGSLLVLGNLALALEIPRTRGADGAGRLAIAVTGVGMLLGVMPAQVLPGGAVALRYLGIAAAVLATLLHLLLRTLPGRSMPRLAPAPGAAVALPYAGSATARRALVVAGLLGVTTALLMGYMKEEARGSYSIYGELTQQQGHGLFNPGPGLYP
jgi:cytochrome bd-type quinol oxidase subunit 1